MGLSFNDLYLSRTSNNGGTPVLGTGDRAGSIPVYETMNNLTREQKLQHLIEKLFPFALHPPKEEDMLYTKQEMNDAADFLIKYTTPEQRVCITKAL